MDAQKLIPLLQRHHLLFAYLFGSQAKGTVTARSDVDIAAFFSPKLSPHRRDVLRLKLAADLMGGLGRNDLDLVVLNEAPPFLAFQAIQPGVVIFSRDELARTRFEARTMSLYFDRLHYFNKSADAMFARVAKTGLR
ncbi:MAG: nucleotidyltransferase domain-containing protein [Elusimicrobia bacterium]|nr:nucleotidyltransferase domain-containing protein [Elusimicrobiota bacterium]